MDESADLSALTEERIRIGHLFYEELLAAQGRTNFYPDFVDSLGTVSWYASTLYETDGGTIGVFPVQSEAERATRGVFLYYVAGEERKLRFYRMAEVYERASGNKSGDLSDEQRMVLFSAINADVRSGYYTGYSEVPEGYWTVLEGGKNKDGLEEGCEGGEFVHQCARVPNGDEHPESVAGVLDNQFLDSKFNPWHNFTIEDIRRTGLSPTVGEGPFQNGYGDNSGLTVSNWRNYVDYREIMYSLFDIGGDGLLKGGRGVRYRYSIAQVCQDVWVPCWADPNDFEWGSSGGGISTNYDLNESERKRLENLDRFRLCRGVNDAGDVHDTGDGNPESVHPDYDFCTIWQDYYDDCIKPLETERNDEFTDNSPLWADRLSFWARLLAENETAFDQIVSNPSQCVATDDLDEYEPEVTDTYCNALIESVANNLGVSLNRPEQIHMLEAIGGLDACGSAGVEELIVGELVRVVDERLRERYPTLHQDIDRFTTIYGETNLLKAFGNDAVDVESVLPGLLLIADVIVLGVDNETVNLSIENLPVVYDRLAENPEEVAALLQVLSEGNNDATPLS